MTPGEIREEILDILSDIAPDEDLSDLKDEVAFRDQLELDSMDFLDIVMELRKRYRVQIPEEDYEQLASMQQHRRVSGADHEGHGESLTDRGGCQIRRRVQAAAIVHRDTHSSGLRLPCMTRSLLALDCRACRLVSASRITTSGCACWSGTRRSAD